MLAELTGLFGGLGLCSPLSAAVVVTRSYVARSYMLEMVLPRLAQAAVSSSPPLQTPASLQHAVKPLVLYLLAVSLTA